MFGYLEGKLLQTGPTQTYLDVQGVGYEVQLTLFTYEAIKDLERCRLFTHLQVREDAWVLYGFYTEREREAFQKLLSVSGVGAATARIVLSSLSAEELFTLVESGNSGALQKVKGIGSKTAQRIILELKGKLPVPDEPEIISGPHNRIEEDALKALLGLGISKTTAEAAIKKTMRDAPADAGIETLIKAALKLL